MGRLSRFEGVMYGGVVLALMFVLSSCSDEQGGSTGEEAPPAAEEVTREVTRTVTVAEAPPAAPRDNPDAQPAPAPAPAPAPSEPPPPPAAPALPEQGSPEGVLALQYSRLNAGDYEGAYALFDEASKQATSADQYRAYFESLAPYSITDYSFPSVNVQGDTATVEAALTTDSAEGGESYQVTQELVRENGAWRPVMRDEQLASFAAAEQETAQYEPESEPTPEGAPAEMTCAVGQVCDLGVSSVTVTSVQQTPAISTSMDTFEGNFVVVEFDYTYGGNAPVDTDEPPFQLTDQDGNTYSLNFEATSSYGIENDRSLIYTTVQPGVTVPGTAIFEVAPEAVDFTLLVEDLASPQANKSARIPL